MSNQINTLISEYRVKIVNCDIKISDKSLSEKELAVVQGQKQAYIQMQKDLESLIIEIEDEQDSINDDLMDIGNKNYKKGYGFIALEIQQKYLLIKKGI